MIFSFGEFELDPDRPELRRAGQPVKVDAVVLRVLVVLVRDAGRLVSKQALLSRVWQGRSVSDNVLTVAMARLRRTLGRELGGHALIVNVHGQGYRFEPKVAVQDGELPPSVLPAALTPGIASTSLLVGRERALARLRESLSAARAGRGGVCAVTGEAGIGKTRVVEALSQEAGAQGFAVAWGHCRDSGRAPPLWPFAQLLRELFRQGALAPHDPRLADALPELVRLLPELAQDTAPREPRTAPFEFEPAGQHRMFDAILRLLAAAAERTPCVLVLDDLHRADALSLELLAYFIDEVARTRVLLLTTLRPEALPASAAVVLGHRNCVRIALERLHEADVAAYVSALLEGETAALSRAVFEKSEGNPFFMTELARAAARQRAPGQRDARGTRRRARF